MGKPALTMLSTYPASRGNSYVQLLARFDEMLNRPFLILVGATIPRQLPPSIPVSPLSLLEDHSVKAGSSRAPQCSGQIYDGTFSQKLIVGDGVTIALLKRNGIRAISEEDL